MLQRVLQCVFMLVALSCVDSFASGWNASPWCNMLQCVAVYCSKLKYAVDVLQCVAACCIVLQCVAAS